MQVKTDKQREVDNGHDGTWVAHPALVTLALEIFNASMTSANQISKSRSDVQVRCSPCCPVVEGAYNMHECPECADPALVTLALEIFNVSMPSANQISKSCSDVQVRCSPCCPVVEGAYNMHECPECADPALVTLALEIFNVSMPSANQISKSRSDVQVRC